MLHVLALTVIDISVLVAYLLLFPLDDYANVLQWYNLHVAHKMSQKYIFFYGKVRCNGVFALLHFLFFQSVISAQVWLVVAITIERYIEVKASQEGKNAKITQSQRVRIILGVVCACFIYRLHLFLEVSV